MSISTVRDRVCMTAAMLVDAGIAKFAMKVRNGFIHEPETR